MKPPYTKQLHLHHSAAGMISVSETTCTLRYELRSRKIYIRSQSPTARAPPDAGCNPSSTYVPIPDSPKDQLPPSPSSPTNSLTSFHNTSSQNDKALSPELFSHHPPSSSAFHILVQQLKTPCMNMCSIHTCRSSNKVLLCGQVTLATN